MRKPAKPTPKPRNERDDEEPSVFFRIRDARTKRIIASTESEKEAGKLVKDLVEKMPIVMEGFELFRTKRLVTR